MLMRFNNVLRSARLASALLAAGFTFQPVSLRADEHRDQDDRGDDRDHLILSFSTVGDSRQDPATPDVTTLPLSGQDTIWLQNTKALTRISRSIEQQQSSLLFFNGDMIMGYGNAIVPAN